MVELRNCTVDVRCIVDTNQVTDDGCDGLKALVGKPECFSQFKSRLINYGVHDRLLVALTRQRADIDRMARLEAFRALDEQDDRTDLDL